MVDILPIIEEELFSDVEDYDSESKKICGKSQDKINSSTENIMFLSSDTDLIKTTEKISSTVEYFKPSSNSIFKESKTESSSQTYPELNKHNIPTRDKIIPLDDESYCFEENHKLSLGDKDLIKSAEIVSSTGEYLKSSDNPMFKESNLKSSKEEYSQLNKHLILTFDKITPPNDESLCFKENHTLPSGDNDLVKTAEKLSSTGERDEFQTSKFSTSEGTNSEENITVSRKDLPVEGSSSPTASTEMKVNLFIPIFSIFHS